MASAASTWPTSGTVGRSDALPGVELLTGMVQFVCKMSDLRAPDMGTQAEVIPEHVVSDGEFRIVLAAPMQLRSSYELICLRRAFDQFPLRLDIAFEHLLAQEIQCEIAVRVWKNRLLSQKCN